MYNAADHPARLSKISSASTQRSPLQKYRNAKNLHITTQYAVAFLTHKTILLQMSESILDQASDYAFARFKEAKGDFSVLPIAIQTVVIVYSAQGIIDNGGLEYFYENDFDGQPEYSFIEAAYSRIGAEEAASAIKVSASMFPFENPHLFESERRQWLDAVRDNEDHIFVKLSRRICGDQSVFAKLADYVLAHQSEFQSS